MRIDKRVERIIIFLIVGLLILAIIYDRKKEDFRSEDTIFALKANDSQGEVTEKIVVQIAGEVKRPGVYEFAPGARVKELVNAAGGFTKNANSDAINLAMRLEDEMKLTVEDISQASLVNELHDTADERININTADLDELTKLPGVGPKTAEKIIEYREKEKFTKPEDIMKVTGIGEKMFSTFKDQIKVR